MNKDINGRYTIIDPKAPDTALMPLHIMELFDLYYSMGPERNISSFYNTYLNRCDSMEIIDVISDKEMKKVFEVYCFDERCKNRNKGIMDKADSFAYNEAEKKAVPIKWDLKRRQLNRIAKMEDVAEAILDVVIRKIPALETADLKTAGEFLRIAERLIEYSHAEERTITKGDDLSNRLTKSDLEGLIPPGFSNYMEKEARKMLGELE